MSYAALSSSTFAAMAAICRFRGSGGGASAWTARGACSRNTSEQF